MSRLRFKIWWLMVLVAAVAVSIFWWNWHHEMLRRSRKYLEMAQRGQLTIMRLRKLGRRSSAGLGGRLFSAFRWTTPEAEDKKYLDGRIAFEKECRHHAVFPWLGEPKDEQ